MRAALLFLVGCATADAMTPPPAAPPVAAAAMELGLNPGETMAYAIRLGGMDAGEAQLAVGQPGDYKGTRAIAVSSKAQTTGAADALKHVVDMASTQIDMATGRTLALETLVETGDKKVATTAEFTGDQIVVTTNDKVSHIRQGKEMILDAHAAMAQLRGWKAAPGATRSVWVLGGKRLWRVDVKLVGAETIPTAMGNRRATRLDAASYRGRANLTVESTTPGRTFSVWLSDDGDRVPLKVTAHTELGEIAMELTDYQRP